MYLFSLSTADLKKCVTRDDDIAASTEYLCFFGFQVVVNI